VDPTAPALPAEVTPAARVGFAVGHAVLLALVGWLLVGLFRRVSTAAAAALAEEPLQTAVVALAVLLPAALLGYALLAVGGLGTLLVVAAATVFAPVLLLADAFGALAVGWAVLDRTGHDPDSRHTAVVLLGAVVAAAVWVVPVVGPALGAGLAALGLGAGVRALFLPDLDVRAAVAAGR
jgi:hypothetical protein